MWKADEKPVEVKESLKERNSSGEDFGKNSLKRIKASGIGSFSKVLSFQHYKNSVPHESKCLLFKVLNKTLFLMFFLFKFWCANIFSLQVFISLV